MTTFPVSFDVGALSYAWPTGWAVLADTTNVLQFTGPIGSGALAAGDYALVHESFAQGEPVSVAFHVGDDGTFSYDASLEGVLGGAGTTTLVAHGLPVHVDATPINAHRNLYMVGAGFFSSSQFDRTFRLLPGPHGFLGAGRTFRVGVDGTVSYAPGDEGFYHGAGTSTLVVNGLVLRIDARDLTVYNVSVNDGVVFPPAVVTEAHAFPGETRLLAPSGLTSSAGSQASVVLHDDDTITFGPELSGILETSGPGQLRVRGAPIDVDGSRLSYATLMFGYFDFPQSTTGKHAIARVLPGAHKLGYLGASGRALVRVDVGADGRVAYDPSLEGTLGGQGTTSVVAYGGTITIDGSAMTPPGFILEAHLASPSARTVTLIPGTHFVSSTDRSLGVSMTMTPEGRVDYPSTLDDRVFGRGGSTLYLGAPPPPPPAPPPSVSCVGTASSPVTVAAAANNCSAVFDASNAGSCASGNGAPVVCSFDGAATLNLGPGDHAIAVVATGSDGQTARCTSRVRVVDVTPPNVVVTAGPATLWPPDGTLRPITLSASATDACGASPVTCEAVSSEGAGPGHADPDVVWSGAQLSLRADRRGKGPGRTYTITCRAQDGSGNEARSSAIVTVPHDAR